MVGEFGRHGAHKAGHVLKKLSNRGTRERGTHILEKFARREPHEAGHKLQKFSSRGAHEAVHTY